MLRLATTINKISTAYFINRDNLAVSPDGKIVAYFDIVHRMIKLWDTQSGDFLKHFEICDVVSKIVFSQNSKFIIGVQDRYFDDDFPQNIITWEVATGRKVKSIDYLNQGDWDSKTVNQYGDLLAIIFWRSQPLKTSHYGKLAPEKRYTLLIAFIELAEGVWLSALTEKRLRLLLLTKPLSDFGM